MKKTILSQVIERAQKQLAINCKPALPDSRTEMQRRLDDFFATGPFGCNTAHVATLVEIITGSRPATPPQMAVSLPQFSIFLDRVAGTPALILLTPEQCGTPCGHGFLRIGDLFWNYDPAREPLADYEASLLFIQELKAIPAKDFQKHLVDRKIKLTF